MDSQELGELAWVLVVMSLMSFGGGPSIIAGLENELVRQRGWLSEDDFVRLFAVSRAAPGPGTMLATLIGWGLAGWTGAIVATLALFLPSTVLYFAIFRTTNHHRDARWHKILREGLAPVGTGLMIAGGIAILRVSGGGLLAFLIAGAAAIIFYRFPGIPALIVIVGGGLITVAIRIIA